MRISIFGLGYVGSVCAACLARDGHSVVGVDPATAKTELINAGKSPIVEQNLETLIAAAVTAGRLRATADVADAIANSDLSFVCVGTPSHANGSLDVSAVRAVCEQIGTAIAAKSTRHTVVIRSTILPGTMRDVVRPALESATGMTAGVGFGLANNPEFLREGSAVKDFDNPPKTVIGASDDETAAQVKSLFSALPGPMIVTAIEVAEMVKYADNAWHAVKVAFGNEIGNLCKALAIDSHKVMDIFCQDTKLNLSPYYLKPGFAFGGSCLPKDVRAITHKARTLDVSLPLLEHVLPSNREQVDRAFRLIESKGVRRIGVLGFSFKAGTDDLRESPMVDLIERMLGKGYDLRLYDRSVELARLQGANRAYILNVIPHISKLMTDQLDDVLTHAELVILGNGDPLYFEVLTQLRADQHVLDMVRAPEAQIQATTGHYDGVNW